MTDGLPVVSDILQVKVGDDDHVEDIVVVAVDLDEQLWTCMNRWGEVRLYRFDENLNYWEIGVDVAQIDWGD